MAEKKSSRRKVRPDQLREIGALALLALSIFGLLALVGFSYEPTGAGNPCGRVGYSLAFESVLWFGWCAYLLFVFGVLWAFALLLRRAEPRPLVPKVFGLGVLVIGAAILCEHRWPLDAPGVLSHASNRFPAGAGGVSGYVLAPYLQDGFGSLGTYLILGLLLSIALLLATDFAFFPAIIALCARWRGGSREGGDGAERGGLGAALLVGLRRSLTGLWEGLLGRPALVEGSRCEEAGERDRGDRGAGARVRWLLRRVGGFFRAEPPIFVRDQVLPETPRPQRGGVAGVGSDRDPQGAEQEAEPADPLADPLEVGAAAGEGDLAELGGVSAGDGLSEMTAVENMPAEEGEDVDLIPAAKAARGAVARRSKKGKRGAGGPELPFPSPAYTLPPLDLLEPSAGANEHAAADEIRANGRILEAALDSFRIAARVVGAQRGPVVTMYELELAAGTKVSRLTALSDDLAIALKAPSVRVVAPIPGRSTVGVEAPNSIRELVRLDELVIDEIYDGGRYAIPLLLGKDVGGKKLIDDLTKMPHLLIAGATGSGKSVCINSVICSVLLARRPEKVKLILIDPKMVELQAYQRIPHLICPVVTNMRKAPGVLDWAVQEMESRYELLSQAHVRNIASFNRLGAKKVRTRLGEAFTEDTPTHLPYIVVVVDELADLMMQAAKEIEASITRLAQKSRAIGIHVILATQRPSTNVITGLIKANMPTRIAFQVASKIDSRVILDYNGAETLLGGGDMLYAPPGTSALWRAQGTFLSDAEIRRIVDHVAGGAAPQFIPDLLDPRRGKAKDDGEEGDELYEKAVRIILKSQRGSASLLQRALGIGYTRASRLIDLMTADGLVGEYKGSQAREVMMSLEEWESSRMGSGNTFMDGSEV